jgi:hypothetical protein
MQALRGFPPTFSDGQKNALISFVLSLSETVGVSGSESSDGTDNGGSVDLRRSAALRVVVEGFSVIS